MRKIRLQMEMKTSGKAGIAALKKGIRRDITGFIIGCILFLLAAMATIIIGLVTVFDRDADLPYSFLMLSAGGLILLWEMAKALRVKAAVPKGYVLINEEDIPPLFSMMKKVAGDLGMEPPARVYLCPDASAAVFAVPDMMSLIKTPRDRNLVMGLGFLTQMDDDEVRAVLYHEFGHYVQNATADSSSVYAVGQFSRSFIAGNTDDVTNFWQMQTRNQQILFSYYTMWICRKIRRKYSELSRQMEYDADDVAACHAGRGTLQRTLVHAACISYNFRMMQWAMKRLENRSLSPKDFYSALTGICRFSIPERRLVGPDIIRRVERLGPLAPEKEETRKWSVRNHIRQSDLIPRVLAGQERTEPETLSASQFTLWMKDGARIYRQLLLRRRSVTLVIHLDRKKHFLPFAEGIYEIMIDGKTAGTGNFIKGYDIRRKISPGNHVLSVRVPGNLGIACDPYRFDVEESGHYWMEMDYRYEFRGTRYRVFVKDFRKYPLSLQDEPSSE